MRYIKNFAFLSEIVCFNFGFPFKCDAKPSQRLLKLNFEVGFKPILDKLAYSVQIVFGVIVYVYASLSAVSESAYLCCEGSLHICHKLFELGTILLLFDGSGLWIEQLSHQLFHFSDGKLAFGSL